MSVSNPKIFEQAGSSLLLYRDAPSWDGKPCAAIGALKFQTDADGKDLLNTVISDMSGEKYHAILGPMNGDTWHSYRSVTHSDNSTPFMLEPTSGPHDLSALKAVGFKPVSHYHSNRAILANTLTANPVVVNGVKITQWDGKNGEALVDMIFDMSADSFSKNKFFKPISREAFHALYVPLLTAIDPRFVLLATHETGNICGFLFGFADLSAPKDNPTIILKTYASGMRGVGFALADFFHRTAISSGYKSVIHALMHEDNVSLKRSQQHNATTFRRYALLARKL